MESVHDMSIYNHRDRKIEMCLTSTVFIIVLLFIYNGLAVPPYPSWPETYKSCVNVETEREFIRAGWYVETEQRRMRLDSYGVPEGLNASTAQLFQDVLRQTESFDYACEQFGPPLYIFIYYYAQSQMLSIFPDPDPPYRKCTLSSIFNKFPNSPLLPDVEFVEQNHDNYTTFNHWRSEFFLFTMDYYFHSANGLPYKLQANGEENLFMSFDVGELDNDTFSPPPGVTCKRQPNIQ